MTRRDWRGDQEKVRFIFDAAMERRKALLKGDFQKMREDLFCDIDDPVLGTVPIGREAMTKLDELSASAVSAAGLAGRIAISTARKALGPLLVQRVIRERSANTKAMLQRTFQEVGVEVSKVLTTRTYLLPCHIADGDEPDTIVIGPVTFLNRAGARALLRSALRAHVTGQPTWERDDRRTLSQALNYYRRYRWVALVTIEDCDPKLAGDYAHAVTTLGLSGLQLFLGAQASQSMAVGGEPWGWARTAELKLNQFGAPDVSLTMAYRGGEHFQSGWSNDLTTPGMMLGLRLLGIALEASLPGVDRPLSNRFIGSLQWYGEAVREKSPATRFIKFITAIEHLVLTDERDGITGLLARRVAALIYEIGSPASRCAAEREFKRLYSIRSKIVHGSAPPWDESARINLRAAAELAENVLHGALNCWREAGLMSPDTRPKRMRAWFAEIVWMMVEATEPVDHVACWRRRLSEQVETVDGVV